MKTYIALAFALALAAAAAPCAAQEVQVGPDRYAVALRHANLHPATPEAARRTLARIDRAAMAVCGASGFSLSEVKRAVRASACWHDAVADTVRRIGDPLLSQTWQDRPLRETDSMTRPFKIVDVFGTDAFTGNPLAVIADADSLSTEEMQRITRWLNLSETAFLLPPTHADADYCVRIFTLARELPFAGHPTLGSCHAWLEAGGQPKREGMIVQECGAGLIEVRSDGDRLAFAAPPLIRGGTPTEAEIAEVANVLRIDHAAIVDAQWADNGPGWIAVMLTSADTVLAVEPARHHHRHIDIGIVGPHAPGDETAFEIRAIFSDAHGALIEDPVTGSLNASVGQWLFASGRATERYVAAQGTCLSRTGRVTVTQDAQGQVWVGGRTVTLFQGHS